MWKKKGEREIKLKRDIMISCYLLSLLVNFHNKLQNDPIHLFEGTMLTIAFLQKILVYESNSK